MIHFLILNCFVIVGSQVQNNQPGQPLQIMDTIRRQEVDILLNTQNNILNTAHEIKSSLMDVHSKTDVIMNNQVRSPTAQVL